MAYLGRVKPTETTSSVLRSTYTGNGSTTTYALPGPVANETSIIATINGVTQQDAAYSTDGSNIIFDAAPASGDSIEIRTISAVAMSYAPMAGSVVTGTIADLAVTTGKINDLAVTGAKIASTTITQDKFSTNVAGNGPAFSAYQLNGSANQSISSDVWTKALLETEEFDTNNNFANGRFTPTVAGYYQINACLHLRNAAACALKIVGIYKSGNIYKQGMQLYFNGNYYIASDTFPVSTIVYLNGTTDYIELYGYISSSSASIGFGSTATWLNGFLVKAA
jgi:hypothetical protein